MSDQHVDLGPLSVQAAVSPEGRAPSLCQLIVCDEAYTSKTCGACGTLYQKLGSNKTFKCAACGYEADRDISAARNILLRYLTREGIGSPT